MEDFMIDSCQIYTISKDGALFDWKYMGRSDDNMNDEEPEVEEDQRWRIADRHYFMQNNAHVNCAAFHPESNLLVVGFSNGIFTLYELPEFNMIHHLR